MPGRFSIRLGRFLGIDVGVDFNWFLIFFFLVVSFSGTIRDMTGVTAGSSLFFAVLVTLLLFASVLAHEYGHALTARIFGIRTNRIILHLFGGVAFLESEPRKPMHEFWIAIAGPAVSIVLGAIFGLIHWMSGLEAGPVHFLLFSLTLLNIILAVFNCLPGFPLDGGRVLRAIVWGLSKDYLFATRFAAAGGVLMGGAVIVWGLVALMIGGPGALGVALLRMLLGGFIIYLARTSVQQARIVHAFRGLTVRDLTRPVRAVIPANTLVSDVYEMYLEPLQTDMVPVIEEGRLLGYVALEDVKSVPRRQWDWTRVQEILRTYDRDRVLDAGAAAISALEYFSRTNAFSAPVFEDRRLLGHVTMRDIARHLQRGESAQHPAA